MPPYAHTPEGTRAWRRERRAVSAVVETERDKARALSRTNHEVRGCSAFYHSHSSAPGAPRRARGAGRRRS